MSRRREQNWSRYTTIEAIAEHPNFLRGLLDAWQGRPSTPPFYDELWAYERARYYVAACRREGRAPLRPIVDGKLNPALIREIHRLFRDGGF